MFKIRFFYPGPKDGYLLLDLKHSECMNSKLFLVFFTIYYRGNSKRLCRIVEKWVLIIFRRHILAERYVCMYERSGPANFERRVKDR